jgi:hypothetical protein
LTQKYVIKHAPPFLSLISPSQSNSSFVISPDLFFFFLPRLNHSRTNYSASLSLSLLLLPLLIFMPSRLRSKSAEAVAEDEVEGEVVVNQKRERGYMEFYPNGGIMTKWFVGEGHYACYIPKSSLSFPLPCLLAFLPCRRRRPSRFASLTLCAPPSLTMPFHLSAFFFLGRG